MIAFNLSVDFEMGWGDLQRLAHDDVFYGRVLAGLDHCATVLETLDRSAVPSTWGAVAACCYRDLDELRATAPAAFEAVAGQLAALRSRRPAYPAVLFARDMIERISRSAHAELGSHGLLHLTPSGGQPAVLRADVTASVRVLAELAGKPVVSFIPPQNYHWQDPLFAGSGIKYVRHTPRVFRYSYSDPRSPAKIARLWNDFVRPVRHDGARLLFLRLDRGARLWRAQLRLIRRLLNRGTGSLFCFTHPHNLDTAQRVQHFAELCDVIAESRTRQRLSFRHFLRELPVV